MRFASLLTQRLGADLVIVISPLMAVSFLVPDLPDRRFEAVLFTSEAGVAAVADGRLAGLPQTALCVGDATAEAARSAGFKAQSAGGDAGALIRMVTATGQRGPLLHLRGDNVTGDVAGHLTAAGIETEERIVYRQSPQPLTPSATALLRGSTPVIVPLFSSRSAALFAGAIATIEARAPLLLVALSPAVAVEIRHLDAALTRVAAEPRAVSMVDTIIEIVTGNPMP